MADELRVVRVDEFTDVVDGKPIPKTRVEWRHGDADGPFFDTFPRAMSGDDIRRALEERVRDLKRIRGEF